MGNVLKKKIEFYSSYPNGHVLYKATNSMLNYEIINNIYKITVPHSNKLIGHFVPDIDGFYYFEPEDGKGYWTEHALLELGNKLKELNQDLYDELQNI
jgi:hypothetical protein